MRIFFDNLLIFFPDCFLILGIIYFKREFVHLIIFVLVDNKMVIELKINYFEFVIYISF